MQVVYKNENKRSSGREANSIDTVICTRGISWYLKENILEDLEVGLLEYKTVREFLVDIKKKFSEGDKEVIKVAEWKRIEQRERTIEEFIQKFRKTARESGYERKSLVEKFKRGINGTICWRLMESK